VILSYSQVTRDLRPCHGASGYLLASHRGGLGSRPGQSMWDLWWTKWYCDGFSLSSSVFPCQYIIPPLLHTYLSPPREVCSSPDQATHYHTLGPKLGASYLTRHWAGTEERSPSKFWWNLMSIVSEQFPSLILKARVMRHAPC
jgi:hypothetical protein